MQCSIGELNKLDFGAHMPLMEEWNESSKFVWKDAYVQYNFPHSTVVHPHTCDGWDALMIAVYLTRGEGDLVSLRVFDRHKEMGQHDYIGSKP